MDILIISSRRKNRYIELRLTQKHFLDQVYDLVTYSDNNFQDIPFERSKHNTLILNRKSNKTNAISRKE